MTEPFELTATKALELIDKNKLSYLEWIESCLGRIKTREPFIKAFSYIDYTRPIELAKKCDQIKKKNFGIPFAAKDIIDIEVCRHRWAHLFIQKIYQKEMLEVSQSLNTMAVFLLVRQ